MREGISAFCLLCSILRNFKDIPIAFLSNKQHVSFTSYSEFGVRKCSIYLPIHSKRGQVSLPEIYLTLQFNINLILKTRSMKWFHHNAHPCSIPVPQ